MSLKRGVGMLNIGICDDFPVYRGVIEEYVRQYGENNHCTFNIWQFGSGEDLLVFLHTNDVSFDLLFLDYRMRILNGLETARRIREMELAGFKTACSIVFVTSMDNAYELLPVNPLRIISKPASQAIINEILAFVLTEKHRAASDQDHGGSIVKKHGAGYGRTV